jgi:hypothetical protein
MPVRGSLDAILDVTGGDLSRRSVTRVRRNPEEFVRRIRAAQVARNLSEVRVSPREGRIVVAQVGAWYDPNLHLRMNRFELLWAHQVLTTDPLMALHPESNHFLEILKKAFTDDESPVSEADTIAEFRDSVADLVEFYRSARPLIDAEVLLVGPWPEEPTADHVLEALGYNGSFSEFQEDFLATDVGRRARAWLRRSDLRHEKYGGFAYWPDLVIEERMKNILDQVGRSWVIGCDLIFEPYDGASACALQFVRRRLDIELNQDASNRSVVRTVLSAAEVPELKRLKDSDILAVRNDQAFEQFRQDLASAAGEILIRGETSPAKTEKVFRDALEPSLHKLETVVRRSKTLSAARTGATTLSVGVIVGLALGPVWGHEAAAQAIFASGAAAGLQTGPAFAADLATRIRRRKELPLARHYQIALGRVSH